MRLLRCSLVVAALVTVAGLPADAAARTASAAATCAEETKRLKTFKRGMKAAKRRFFRTHRAQKARKRFVRR